MRALEVHQIHILEPCQVGFILLPSGSSLELSVAFSCTRLCACVDDSHAQTLRGRLPLVASLHSAATLRQDLSEHKEPKGRATCVCMSAMFSWVDSITFTFGTVCVSGLTLSPGVMMPFFAKRKRVVCRHTVTPVHRAKESVVQHFLVLPIRIHA